MVHFSTLSLLALVALANAAPMQKRIAQVIADATHDWEQACLKAGGASQCNPLSIQAFSSLLAGGGLCDQQDAADAMIDLAHQLGSDADMIRLTQLFRQQPRNAPDSLSVLYCNKGAKNSEIQGLFQCQFQGVNPTVFTGNVAVGGANTIPFGLSSPVNPPGSCAASKTPVSDGQQLEKLVSDPGVGKATAAAPSAKAAPPPPAASAASAPPPAQSAASAPPAAAPDAKSFTLQNGLDAQALNAKFATLTASSPCTAGEDACLGDQFAQCVGSAFVQTGCAAGTVCRALPLVNKAGTSITCTTDADALARIAATGATGGLTGSGSKAAPPAKASSAAPPPAQSSAAAAAANVAAPPAKAPAGAKSFTLQNGLDAQKLNREFAQLSTSSSCNAGDNACINGGFAQCVSNKFVVIGCAAGTTCAGVPLVNSAGTSIVCTTQADALARIAATGATGGLTGN